MKVLKWLDRHFEEVLAVILTAAMLIILFLGVLFRYAINLPLAWSDELSLFFLIYMCYFGASLAVRERKHLRVDIILVFLPPRVRLYFELLANFAFFLFISVMTVELTKITAFLMGTSQVTAATNLPKWLVYLPVPVAFVLICVRLIQDTLRYIREFPAQKNAVVCKTEQKEA